MSLSNLKINKKLIKIVIFVPTDTRCPDVDELPNEFNQLDIKFRGASYGVENKVKPFMAHTLDDWAESCNCYQVLYVSDRALVQKLWDFRLLSLNRFNISNIQKNRESALFILYYITSSFPAACLRAI